MYIEHFMASGIHFGQNEKTTKQSLPSGFFDISLSYGAVHHYVNGFLSVDHGRYIFEHVHIILHILVALRVRYTHATLAENVVLNYSF